MRKLYILGLIGIFGIIFSVAFAETITLTTYYPAPYGVYKEMRAKRMAIGDNYYQGSNYYWPGEGSGGTEIDANADLIVEGNVGIGTASPAALLELKGDPTGGKFVTLDRTENAGISNKFDIGVGATGGVDLMYLGKTYGDMVIRSDGNVGIGTTDPGAKLHVNGEMILGNFRFFEVNIYENWTTGDTMCDREGATCITNSFFDGVTWHSVPCSWGSANKKKSLCAIIIN